MRLGVHITRVRPPARAGTLSPELAAAGSAAEAAGVSWLSVMDHYFQTKRWRRRASHAGVLHHPQLPRRAHLHRAPGRTGDRSGPTAPWLLAKIVTTLDVLSGPATLGIGAACTSANTSGSVSRSRPRPSGSSGWRGAADLPADLGPAQQRPVRGSHYQLAETRCVPPRWSTPHPESMIGGSGEQRP